MDYRQLFDRSPVPVIVLDTETWTPLEFNNAAAEFMGYSRGEFARLTITDFEYVPNPSETREHINLIRRKGADEFTCVHRSKSGDPRRVQISISMVSWMGREGMLTVWNRAPGFAPPIVFGDGSESSPGAPHTSAAVIPIIARSPVMRRVLATVDRIGQSEIPVLIRGETGTGKELIARRVHELSPRAARPFVPINCGALPRDIADGELFGVERGAYTGADRSRPGLFESADGGTIFLDEVGEMEPSLQVRLLRVLQEGEFYRVGSTRPTRVNVRVVAATNRDLHAAVQAGAFREDLYYRLSGMCINLPPLRERVEDIEPLVSHMLRRESGPDAPLASISDGDLHRLLRHSWPGNVRELQNVVRGALAMGKHGQLSLEMFEGSGRDSAALVPSERLDDSVRAHMLSVLARTRWTIEGTNGAAARLGLHPSTLRSQMHRLGITRPGSPGTRC
jgi:formate hydrogenlyase transcriptional activator